MEKLLTVICPVISPGMIERCLETFYANTDNIFYFYIIDQTIAGLDSTALRNKYKNLMVIRSPKSDVHYTGNLGFSLATNLGVKLTETPYFMMINDDVEMVHPAWWDGVMESFKMIEKATPASPAIIVNVASIRLADWSVGAPAGEDYDILPYKEKYTNEDWEFLVDEPHYINEHLTIQPGSVFDGVTLYASVVKTKEYREIGGTDDKYYVGAGEDYDLSCKARMFGYRSVNTTLSWCFHHWSTSFKDVRDKQEIKATIIPELEWNQNHEKWGPGFDIWGVKCECGEIMLTNDGITATCPKDGRTYQMPPNSHIPL